ncbi:hypothetical protein M885DRAFT_611817 [Pelagophyceae sp. CCMP2097]|nr:hypothetical protein M885DRAFT_611817 [Pelagophyceae sp. CCMP2097]
MSEAPAAADAAAATELAVATEASEAVAAEQPSKVEEAPVSEDVTMTQAEPTAAAEPVAAAAAVPVAAAAAPAAAAAAPAAAAPAAAAAAPAAAAAAPAAAAAKLAAAAPAAAAKPTISLAGFEFASRSELWAHVQSLQRTLDADAAACKKSDEFFLFSLLMMHPSAPEKMKSGIESFGYGVNDDFPDTKSFYIQRADKSKSGFSARKCIDIVFPSEASAPPSYGDTPAAKRSRLEGSGKGGSTARPVSSGKGGASWADRNGGGNHYGNGGGQPAAGHYSAAPASGVKRDYASTAASPGAKPAYAPRGPGALVQVGGLEGQAIGFQELKDALCKYANVRYVDLDDDLGTATVRFDDAASAKRVVGDCKDINGCAASLRVLTPEDEEKYQQKCDADRIAKGGRTNQPLRSLGGRGMPSVGRGKGGKGGGKGGGKSGGGRGVRY